EEAGCGVFVEPENPIDFAQKIQFYIANPDMIQIHGHNGYSFAKTHFDRAVLADKYLEILSRVNS
ncbi:MAG: glycosyltransferase WbuB, partial [Cytophagales bacterium]